MEEGRLPVTRLSVAPAPFSKWAEAPPPTEKSRREMMAFRDDWVTSRFEPVEVIVAAPEATPPPVGRD
jgi:hypothetical protein